MTNNNIKFDERYTKNSVSGHCLPMSISKLPVFGAESDPAFDAELNGLQSGARFLVEVSSLLGHLIEILKNR